METLFYVLNSIRPLSAELQNFLESKLKYKELKKNDFLLREGEVCKSVYFIQQGLIYSYYTLEKGDRLQEACNWIYQTHDVIFSVFSFYQQKPSYENIVCLEDSSFYYISQESLYYAYENFIEFNYIGRILTEKYYLDSESRLHALRKQTAKDRYEIFIKNYPNLIEKIPLKIIASFLGMNNATLSRIRGD